MSSSEPVRSLLEVFRCGKRTPMFACGLLRGVGTNCCAQSKRAVWVPAVSVRWSVVPPNAPELEQVEGITVEGIVDAGVRLALFSEHLSAFVALCMLLNRQSQFSVFTQDVDRQRSDGLRANMLARLEERATGKETIPFRRAKRLIVAADPGCENPAEAALLWVVKSVSAFEVVTHS